MSIESGEWKQRISKPLDVYNRDRLEKFLLVVDPPPPTALRNDIRRRLADPDLVSDAEVDAFVARYRAALPRQVPDTEFLDEQLDAAFRAPYTPDDAPARYVTVKKANNRENQKTFTKKQKTMMRE